MKDKSKKKKLLKIILMTLCLVVIVGVVYPTILAVMGISGGVYLITKLTYRKYSVLSSRHTSNEE